MYCPQCGTFNSEEVAFCGTCGTPMSERAVSVQREGKWRKMVSSPLMLACTICFFFVTLINIINVWDRFQWLSVYDFSDIESTCDLMASLLQPVAYLVICVGMCFLYVEGMRKKARSINTVGYTILLSGAGLATAVAFVSFVLSIMQTRYYLSVFTLLPYVMGIALGTMTTLALCICATILLIKSKNNIFADPGKGLRKAMATLLFVQGGIAILALLLSQHIGMTVPAAIMLIVVATNHFLMGALLLSCYKKKKV